MFWPDEIREARFAEVEQDVAVSDQDLKMSQMLIEGLTEDFQPSAFSDEYRKALMDAVQKKIEGQEIVAAAAPEEAPAVVDLTEALKRSLEQVKARDKKAAGA
jgi:DNA end-binding protein Ku